MRESRQTEEEIRSFGSLFLKKCITVQITVQITAWITVSVNFFRKEKRFKEESCFGKENCFRKKNRFRKGNYFGEELRIKELLQERERMGIFNES